MNPNETDDRLPPTQRRGRNGWDALAEIVRVIGRGVSGFVGLAVSPGGIFLIVVGLVVAGLLNPQKLGQLVDALSGLLEKVK